MMDAAKKIAREQARLERVAFDIFVHRIKHYLNKRQEKLDEEKKALDVLIRMQSEIGEYHAKNS